MTLLEESFSQLNHLLVYRNILDDPIIDKLGKYTEINDKKLCCELAFALIQKAEQLGLAGNLPQMYLLYLVAIDENIFSLTAENGVEAVGPSLQEAAEHDLLILRDCMDAAGKIEYRVPTLQNYQPATKSMPGFLDAVEKIFLSIQSGNFSKAMINHYAEYGCGKVAGFTSFRWNETTGLQGITNPDSITFNDIVGYEYQKQVLIQNTEAFLQGKPANNALLVGARGTGKSSSVKALLNKYYTQGLRLVEVSKYNLSHLSQIMEYLKGRGKKFIVFMDDLSFEDFEVDYKYLKSVLDGGVEARPDSVLLYATSNRRHLIKENWSDRTDNADEVHALDTVNEKISLSDRFGITLVYLPPTQQEYFSIVRHIAEQKGISFSAEDLHKKAVQWEMSHNGRSGRSAQQFITYLLSK